MEDTESPNSEPPRRQTWRMAGFGQGLVTFLISAPLVIAGHIMGIGEKPATPANVGTSQSNTSGTGI